MSSMLREGLLSDETSPDAEAISDVDSEQLDDTDPESFFIPIREFYPGPQAGSLSFITREKTAEERSTLESEQNRRAQMRKQAAEQPSVRRDEQSNNASDTFITQLTQIQQQPQVQELQSLSDLDSQRSQLSAQGTTSSSGPRLIVSRIKQIISKGMQRNKR